MMIVALLLSLLVTFHPAVDRQDPDKRTTVRAYVFTAIAQSGQKPADEQARLEAVRDMKDALQHKKGIHLVDDRADATLVVEVVGREQKDDVQGPFGGRAITPLGGTIIRTRVTSGDHESDIKGMGQGTWGRAAKDAADRILKWIARWEPSR
jgi:hypothetical protein